MNSPSDNKNSPSSDMSNSDHQDTSSLDQLEELWEAARSAELSETEQVQLKSLLSTPDGRAQWQSLSALEQDLEGLLSSELDRFKEVNFSKANVQKVNAQKMNSDEATSQQANSRQDHLSHPKGEDDSVESQTVYPLSKTPSISLSQDHSRSQQPGKSTFRFGALGTIVALVMVAFLLSLQLGLLKGPSKNLVIAQAIHVEGEVRVKRGPVHIMLRSNMGIKEDDRVLTGADGQLTLAMKDGSLIEVSNGARLKIGGHVQTEGQLFQLARGQMKIEAKPQKQPMIVELPQIEISVLGTRFWVSAEKEHSIVELYEGSLALAGTHEQGTQERLEISAGQRAEKSKGDLKISQSPMEAMEREVIVLNKDLKLGYIKVRLNDGSEATMRIHRVAIGDVWGLDPKVMAELKDVQLGESIMVSTERGTSWSLLRVH
jgi:hypothetical protein